MSITIPIKYIDLCHFEAKNSISKYKNQLRIPFKNVLKKIFKNFIKKINDFMIEFRGNNWSIIHGNMLKHFFMGIIENNK